ncbi:MAG: flagellar biosynthesis protein FlgA [delta proteobacterium MLS_D]|jgi:flagellar P-ring protein FlgI|nr:MAG: flagellar biosynthesis protein FlgA [delta proteobacterium MLS_D]
MIKPRAITVRALLAFLAVVLFATSAPGARIKDIADIGGVRDNQLVGYGLIVGLSDTGDSMRTGFTDQTLSNLLSRQGLSMKNKDLRAANIASVMVTASLPAFAKIGNRIDVTVSSIGDAESLQGGTLIMTPLRGADGHVYAVAQGSVVIGGFSAGSGGSGVSKNHTTVGSIPNGAFVERELAYDFKESRAIAINLHAPDFTTCRHLAEILNSEILGISVDIRDSGTVTVTAGDECKNGMVALVSEIEHLEIPVDSAATVVINEKTGTVVIGEKVRISTVAVAHGNLSITIKEHHNVSQPLPFAPSPERGGGTVRSEDGTIVAPGGQTVVTTEEDMVVDEEKRQLMVVPQGVTIQEVVSALNALGVTPRDLIAILKAIKVAGALQADLVIM